MARKARWAACALATAKEGEKPSVYVNVDNVAALVHVNPDTTRIVYSGGAHIEVKGSPRNILANAGIEMP
jgi:hypothetical protein